MVGSAIRARREARGLSQTDLAAQTGLAPTYISRIERGAIARPRRATLQKLSQALGVRLPELYGEAGIPDPLAIGEPATFAAWLRRTIALRGFPSEREFAAHVGMAPKHLSRLLAGEIERPTYATMRRIAGALQLPIGEVVEWAHRPAEAGAYAGQAADAATGALFALLDHLREAPDVMAQLDALGTLEAGVMRDIGELLTVYLRGVLRARAAAGRAQLGGCPTGRAGCR